MSLVRKWNKDEVITCRDAVELAKAIHYRKQDFEEGDLEERIKRFWLYELQTVPLSDIERGGYFIDEETVKEFAEKSPDTAPPIILGERYGGLYDVVDGNHRVETFILQGLKEIPAYVPVWDTRTKENEL